ncbi:MAG: hypothetical protein E6Q67_00920 [Roseateles sp.]|nr:MAG: hypothetical protein E6Q67_00920 [Roseateles sp.]
MIRKLHDQAGIETAGATAARRTFGVRLKREGYDLRHIREVLGLATLSAAKALCCNFIQYAGRCHSAAP